MAGFIYELSRVGRCFRFKAVNISFIDIGDARMFNRFCTCSVACSVTCLQMVTLKSPSCSNRGFFRPCCRQSFTISPVPVPAFSMNPERCRGFCNQWVVGVRFVRLIKLLRGQFIRQLSWIPNLETVFEQHHLYAGVACVVCGRGCIPVP